MNDDSTVTTGSGNVFADLGLENPEEAQLKAQLVREICAIINGRVHRFSLERLLRCVRRLDREVALVVRPRPGVRAIRTKATATPSVVA